MTTIDMNDRTEQDIIHMLITRLEEGAKWTAKFVADRPAPTDPDITDYLAENAGNSLDAQRRAIEVGRQWLAQNKET